MGRRVSEADTQTSVHHGAAVGQPITGRAWDLLSHIPRSVTELEVGHLPGRSGLHPQEGPFLRVTSQVRLPVSDSGLTKGYL